MRRESTLTKTSSRVTLTTLYRFKIELYMDGNSVEDSETSYFQPDTFKLQILSYDSYQCAPSSLDKQKFTINGKEHGISNSFTQVPIIRIYGKLQTGHNCLLHIHNVFPYIYVKYFHSDHNNSKVIEKRILALRHEINVKIRASFQWKKKSKRRKKTENEANRHLNSSMSDEEEKEEEEDDSNDDETDQFESSINEYVSDISLIRGTPFYGYHFGYSPFLKISLIGPKYVRRLTRLLFDGKIFGDLIQPFEAHIPYTLQFLMDYNCYCSNWIGLSKIYWRFPLVFSESRDDYQQFFETDFPYYNKLKINNNLKVFLEKYVQINKSNINILDSEKFPRIGRSILELDSSASYILNRKRLKQRLIHECLFEPNFKNERFLSSTKSLLNDVQFLRKQRNLPDDPKLKLFEKIKRDYKNSDWTDKEELDKLFKYCCNLSEGSFKKLKGDKKLNVQNVVIDQKWLETYPTAFESIEKLIFEYEDISNDLMVLNEQHLGEESLIIDCLLSDKNLFTNSDKFSQKTQNILDSMCEEQYQYQDENDDGNDIKLKHNLNDEIIKTEDNEFLGSIPHLSSFMDESTEGEEQINEPNRIFLKKNAILPKNVLNGASLLTPRNLTPLLYEEPSNEEIKNPVNIDLKIFEATQVSTKFNDSLPLNSVLSSFHTVSKDEAGNEHHVYFADIGEYENLYLLTVEPPIYLNKDEFLSSMESNHRLLKIEYPDPFYSNRGNYDSKPFIFAGKKIRLKCGDLSGLEYYPYYEQHVLNSIFSERIKSLWLYANQAPSFTEIDNWIRENNEIRSQTFESQTFESQTFESQIEGPTQNCNGFKYPSLQTPIERKENHFNKLLMLTLEIHVITRGELNPDPLKDQITAIFWHFDKDNFAFEADLEHFGVFVVDKDDSKLFSQWSNTSETPIQSFEDEKAMIIGLISLVEFLDPDILAGYEIHALSWGYIIERFKAIYHIDLSQRLSRVAIKHNNIFGDRWGYTHASSIRITGRHMLNIWRTLKNELRLGHYSLENIVFHILHEKMPHYTWRCLNNWWNSQNSHLIEMVMAYNLNRIKHEFELIKRLEIVEKITEQSKLLGIDFYSLIYRGSQFKVECLLVRLAKEENFILISPSKKQVFKQDPLQSIPLVMEPQSAFYKSPVVVLDFQSLYPSIIIAYNICYSTFMGRLRGFDPNKYQKTGVSSLKLPKGLLKLLEKHINVTPNGMMFAKTNVRQSVLSKMLTDLLDARILVKGTMAAFKDDLELNKLYSNRQLALKLIANVTYGYTSATFSGRMPNSDIADAIVSSGRETLLKAVKEIESTAKWGAKVVYGDTDSLFVYLPGKSKIDAFRIGKEMAARITSLNPAPMKLKFEKVYLPSILVSKKRYIGWSFEMEQQKEPKFDAKGIETVRRDGIPAQQKMLEKAINILFKFRDISLVKDYVVSQFIKIVKNKVNIKDFLFAKEVRLGTYKNPAYIPPGARVSMRKIENDPRAEPQYKERVFYIVRKGHKREKLRDRCVSPSDFLKSNTFELDSDYYIHNVLIPPLERIFSLSGVDVRRWEVEIPRFISYRGAGKNKLQKLRIRSAVCICCGNPSGLENNKLCTNCCKNELKTIASLKLKMKAYQEKLNDYLTVCKQCAQKCVRDRVDLNALLNCWNEDCSVFYGREKVVHEINDFQSDLMEIPDW